MSNFTEPPFGSFEPWEPSDDFHAQDGCMSPRSQAEVLWGLAATYAAALAGLYHHNEVRDVLLLIVHSIRAPSILSATGQEQFQNFLPSCHFHHLPNIPFLRPIAELDPCDMGKL